MPDDQLEPVLEIVTTLARKAAAGGYIFRGEPICYDLVSSSLYRVYPGLEVAGFDIEDVQLQMLDKAKEYHSEGDDREILTQLQHYGGKTNLIDFTTDYLVALFFACDGGPGKDGRVVLLPKSGEGDAYTIWQPHSPAHRVIAQKSIFVEPAQGFVEVGADNQVIIPGSIKQSLLNYLDVCHGISARTVYNDLHGSSGNRTRRMKLSPAASPIWMPRTTKAQSRASAKLWRLTRKTPLSITIVVLLTIRGETILGPSKIIPEQ